jgi:protein involved in polysaccharide export with SLBB domain
MEKVNHFKINVARMVLSLLVWLFGQGVFAATPGESGVASASPKGLTNTDLLAPVGGVGGIETLPSVAPGTNAAMTRMALATNVYVAMAATMDTLDDKHRLASGDQLSLRIVEDLEDPKILPVTDSGDLEVPYIGRFPARDKTCKQLASQLKQEFEKEYYYRATVILGLDLLSKNRGRVYIIGAIRMPGPQDIPSDEEFTLSKAITRAGGFADFADRRRVRITRKSAVGAPPQEPIVINAGEIIDKGKSLKDIRLEPDDLIYIPNRLVNF